MKNFKNACCWRVYKKLLGFGVGNSTVKRNKERKFCLQLNNVLMHGKLKLIEYSLAETTLYTWFLQQYTHDPSRSSPVSGPI